MTRRQKDILSLAGAVASILGVLISAIAYVGHWASVSLSLLGAGLITWRVVAHRQEKRFLSKSCNNAIFCYGSLLEPVSIGRTLEREVSEDEFLPVFLRNYQRIWTAPVPRINMVLKSSWQPVDGKNWLSLALAKEPGQKVAGALVLLTNREVSQIDLRERSYDRVELSEFDFGMTHRFGKKLHSEVRFFTYLAKDFHLERTNPTPGVARSGYINMVERALRRLDLPDDLPSAPDGAIDAVDADLAVGELLSQRSFSEERAWGLQLRAMLNSQKIYRAGKIDPPEECRSLTRALVLNSSAYAKVMETAAKAVEQVSAALRHTIEHGDLLASAQFEQEEIEIARFDLARDWSTKPTFARVDMIVNRSQIKILEVNSDSPAGIAHIDSLIDWFRDHGFGTASLPAVFQSPEFKTSAGKVARYSILKEALGEALLRGHSELLGDAPRTVAILDQGINSQPSRYEFQSIAQFLQSKIGDENVVICEPEALTIKNRRLVYRKNGMPIDLVYKRMLWGDMLDARGSLSPLLTAYKDGTVRLVNNLTSRLAGNKMLLSVLSTASLGQAEEWNLGDLAASIREFLPESRLLFGNEDLFRRIQEERRGWVLKPYRGGGGNDVVFQGDRNAWRSNVRKAFRSGGALAQRAIEHGRIQSSTIELDGMKNLQFIVGVYVVEGKPICAEVKAGNRLPVSMNHEAARGPVVSILEAPACKTPHTPAV